MNMQDVIDEIKLELTGGVLELELEDTQLHQVVNKALRELERYWDETTMITIPFSSCIDLADSALDLKEKVSSITRVYRTEGTGVASSSEVSVLNDPMYMQQWTLFSNGGTMYNLNDYVLNYASWATLQKITNSMSTDMAYTEDRHNNKLYINHYMTSPAYVTIEYVPKLKKVDDIKSDYWIDNLIKISVALTKIILGRIRSRFTQSNALWTQDGDKLSEEGNTELKELREVLRANSNLIYPID